MSGHIPLTAVNREVSSMSDRQVPIGFFGAHTDRYSVNNQAVLERELQVMKDAGYIK